jgi:hypothetical protein
MTRLRERDENADVLPRALQGVSLVVRLYIPHCSRFHFHPQVQISFRTVSQGQCWEKQLRKVQVLPNTPPHS